MCEPGSVTSTKILWLAVFLYIVSQHIQAVSTWVDHFGPNDIANKTTQMVLEEVF